MDAKRESEPTLMKNPTTTERTSDREHVVTRAFNAPVRIVFEAWTRPACSRTPTCFFMPVRVMRNFPARSVIDASARPSCSSTPRRVASESAANEASKRVWAY